MASVQDIIAYGFGSWSTVVKVPTHGFGISLYVVPDVPGAEWTLDSGMADWTLSSGKTDWTLDQNKTDWTIGDT